MINLVRLRRLFRVIKDDTLILYYAWKHPGTPLYIKGSLAAVLMYVLSPIDLLPDYLLGVGLADDIVLISAAILYIKGLLPDAVQIDCRRKSAKWQNRVPLFWGIVVGSIMLWIVLVIVGLGYIISR